LGCQIPESNQPKAAGKTRPLPDRPAAYRRPAFHSLEWNALVNRARASLEAQRACQAEGLPGTACERCLLGGSAPATTESGACPCRAEFRNTLRCLGRLSTQAPGRDRFQLRRTVDCLELDYQKIWSEGGCHD